LTHSFRPEQVRFNLRQLCIVVHCAVQAFVNRQFLTDYCEHVLPTKFAAADYAALLRRFVERLAANAYSATVTTEIIRGLVVPVLKQVADRGLLQEALPLDLLDGMFETIGQLQAPTRLQRLLTNVRSPLA
jgi:hypothetical protein